MLQVEAVFVRFAALEGAGLQLERAADPSEGRHAEDDVGRVQPVVADRRLGIIDPGAAVHEGGGAEGGLARPAGVDEHGVAVRQSPSVGSGQLHDQLVRMLPVDQRLSPVGALAGGEQQGIAALSHPGVRADHGAEVQNVSAFEGASGRAHRHAGDERLVVSARTRLVGVDAVQQHVTHQVPVAAPGVHAFVPLGVRLPAGARGVAAHRVAAENARGGSVLPVRGVAGVRVRLGRRRGRRVVIVPGAVPVLLSEGGQGGRERQGGAEQQTDTQGHGDRINLRHAFAPASGYPAQPLPWGAAASPPFRLRCMKTTSTQRPYLNPTARRTPANSKPQAR